MPQAWQEGWEHEVYSTCCPDDGWMGVPCQIPAVSKHPAAPSTTSRCHGLWEEGPAGAALQAGLWGGPDLFFLHLVILPIIMERLEKFPFMQVSPCFSCRSFPVCPAVPQPCSPAAEMLRMKWGGCRAWFALSTIRVTITPNVSWVTWRGCKRVGGVSGTPEVLGIQPH